MTTDAGAGVVVYRPHPGIDAIDQYSRRLVDALGALGAQACYLTTGLGSVLVGEDEPAWVILQYQPFAWGRRGFAPGLVRDATILRRRLTVPLLLMVHEAWVTMADLATTVMGVWQRGQLHHLLGLADGVMTSTEALARELGRGAVHVPVATNIAPVETSRAEAREQLGLDGRLTVVLFGRGHESRALDYAEAAIAALADARGADGVAVLNLGAGAPVVQVPPGVALTTPGALTGPEISLRLRAGDLALLPFTDGVSTRRGTLMAALAHELPVLGLHGRNTDSVLSERPEAIALTPFGDRPAFARAAVELAVDPRRRRAVGDAGGRLYASSFDWPHLAARVVAQLPGTVQPTAAAATT